MEIIGPGSPSFKMMIEGFLEHAKTQDDSLVEGAVFLFIPDDGNASNTSILSWVPIDRGKEPAVVWQESFVAMVWALMSAGLNENDIHQHVAYAAQYHKDLEFTQQNAGDEDEDVVEN